MGSSYEKESMMGDRYKAIKQKWEIGWITTDVGSSWIMIGIS
jgi:hypothetical protein